MPSNRSGCSSGKSSRESFPGCAGYLGYPFQKSASIMDLPCHFFASIYQTGRSEIFYLGGYSPIWDGYSKYPAQGPGQSLFSRDLSLLLHSSIRLLARSGGRFFILTSTVATDTLGSR